MSDNIIRQDYGTLGTDVQTQTLIAPVLVDMVADRAFAVGDQFIVDSVLYKATAVIAQDDPLVVGTNCKVSDTVTQNIKSVVDQINTNEARTFFKITHTNMNADAYFYCTNNITYLPGSLYIPTGTYSCTVKYNDYYYVSLGYVSGTDLSDGLKSKKDLSSYSIGTVMNLCTAVFCGVTTNTLNTITSMAMYVIKTSSSRWDLILPTSVLRSTTNGASVTTSYNIRAFGIPYIMDNSYAPDIKA